MANGTTCSCQDGQDEAFIFSRLLKGNYGKRCGNLPGITEPMVGIALQTTHDCLGQLGGQLGITLAWVRNLSIDLRHSSA